MKEHKSNLYKKILIKTPRSSIKINCENNYDFLYEMKDVDVYSKIEYYDIKNSFIDIVGMRHQSDGVKFINIGCSDTSSCFTLKQDFSNILDILDRFNLLIKLLSESYRWKYLFLEVDSVLNYVKYCWSDSSEFIYIHTRKDFENFDNLQKYDFVITEKVAQNLSGKIKFDGELLETDRYNIRFMRRPAFDKFVINLDSRINSVLFEVPCVCHKSELISYFTHTDCRYDISFRPAKIEQFYYLKLLNNISWINKSINDYSESDILTKVYRF